MAVDFNSPPPEYTKSHGELKKFKRDYLRDCKPKEYRQLLPDDELERYLQQQADSCRRHEEALNRTGIRPPQAWHWAIRERLLDSERD